MIPNALVQQLQIDFITLVSQLIARGKINLETSKEYAKELQSSLPFTSLDHMKQKIQAFALKNPLFGNLLLTIQRFEDIKNSTAIAGQMTILLNSGKVEEALKLATK